MEKPSLLLVIVFFFLSSLKAGAFWPFEKTWENQADLLRIFVDDNGHEFEIRTDAKTAGQLLLENNIGVSEADYLFPRKEDKLTTGTRVIIRRSLAVTVNVDGANIELRTFGRSVEDAITEAKVTLSHLDKVDPGLKSALEDNQKIKITRINVEEITQEEPIEFKTIEKEDAQLKWRKTRIDQEGITGIREVQYRITYTNGKQTSKVKLSSKVKEAPVDKIIANGTKIEVGKVTKGRASWYAHTGTMACASLQFPRGTWLRVTNTSNGKRVIVQVNDSGPYSDNKIIDLDKVAFQKLGNLGQGVVGVKVEEILE